jgi:hypothetical protein
MFRKVVLFSVFDLNLICFRNCIADTVIDVCSFGENDHHIQHVIEGESGMMPYAGADIEDCAAGDKEDFDFVCGDVIGAVSGSNPDEGIAGEGHTDFASMVMIFAGIDNEGAFFHTACGETWIDTEQFLLNHIAIETDGSIFGTCGFCIGIDESGIGTILFETFGGELLDFYSFHDHILSWKIRCFL